MKIRTYLILILFSLSAGSLFGQFFDTFITDRLGYTGTVVRYNTLADMQDGVNVQDFISIGNRDGSIYFVEDEANIVMGSWWYSTDPDGSGPGYGNTTGNTGVGFMQLYDNDFSTVSSSSMYFDGWDGSYWTEASLSVAGSNAGAEDYSRFSVYDNVNDAGTYFSYALDLTIGGLQGVETSPGWVHASNHPGSVSGTFEAQFELTENQTSPANQGFYSILLSFNMENWAWENRDNLTGPYDTFFDSEFAAAIVPEPSAIGLLSIVGIGGLLYLRRRFKK